MNKVVSAHPPLETQFRLARAWQGKGTLPRAIAGYREVLSIDPAFAKATIQLGNVLADSFRLDEALEVFRAGLRHSPHESQIHKDFVNLLVRQEGLGAVFEHYRLTRADSKIVSLTPAEPLVCTVLRNERARLPYFLEYYRSKGIRTFFAVDNASTDGSFEYLREQPDVYLWRSDLSFHEANFGAAWFEPILRQNASGHWCLIVDADELFYYPDCEHRTIPALCESLDLAHLRAYRAILLDMYSAQPVSETRYHPGQPFAEVCPYFDRRFYHRSYENVGPMENQTAYYGGVRERMFGPTGEYILNKVPLIKYGRDIMLAGGQHWTNLTAERIAKESGCLLHFKFFSSFTGYASEIAHREKYSNWILQHREYTRGLQREEAFSFYDPEHSVRLEDSGQLIELGVMHRDPDAVQPEKVVFPKIDPVPDSDPRPKWSVIVTVYRRSEFLPNALRSVLAQARAPEEMQIEVVSDGPADPFHRELEQLVRAIAGDRVSFYAHSARGGHPEIFNVCLRRARGYWTHILHDDDGIEPGFYDAIDEGIQQAPEAGAIFCRHRHINAQGNVLGASIWERESAGIIENWLEQIACTCRLQTASIAVRRDVYERLGGYCHQAKSAFDWEMWQRIAMYYPVWFDPRVLASFRVSEVSESSRLIASGGQIADARAAMAVARTYLPAKIADKVHRRAAEWYASRAMDLAADRLKRKDPRGALANLREGLLLSQSEETRARLIGLLAHIPDHLL